MGFSSQSLHRDRRAGRARVPHHAYAELEIVEVAALVALGWAALR
jgi:hypothetical protein